MFKLGKLPFVKDDRDILLKDLIDKTILPKPPVSTNDFTLFVDWLMFLNDQLGCCGIAGAYHLLMAWIKQAGKTPDITDAQILQIYEIISGYNPNDPNSDVGINLRDLLKYWKNVGLPDANGKIYKIAAFAKVGQLDHEEIKIAQYLFSGLYIGFMVPNYAMKQFTKGQIWDKIGSDQSADEGHCVVPTGYGKIKKWKLQVLKVTKEGVYVITWGTVQFMSWAFWDQFVDEVWVIFDPIFLDNDKSPDGFDSEQLMSYLKALGEK